MTYKKIGTTPMLNSKGRTMDVYQNGKKRYAKIFGDFYLLPSTARIKIK